MNEISTRESPPARSVETVTLEIRTLQHQVQQMLLSYAIEIGRRLVEVKSLLLHGQWGDYIKGQVGYSQSTANNLMRVFEEYGAPQQSMFGAGANSQALGNLSYTKALRLLAIPADEREAFAEEHHVEELICQGNLIPIFQALLRFALDAESQSYREPGRSEREFEAIMADEKVINLTDVDFLLSPDCRTCQEPTKRVTGKTFDLEGPGMVGVMYGCDNYRCKECKDRKCSYLLAITRM